MPTTDSVISLQITLYNMDLINKLGYISYPVCRLYDDVTY